MLASVLTEATNVPGVVGSGRASHGSRVPTRTLNSAGAPVTVAVKSNRQFHCSPPPAMSSQRLLWIVPLPISSLASASRIVTAAPAASPAVDPPCESAHPTHVPSLNRTASANGSVWVNGGPLGLDAADGPGDRRPGDRPAWHVVDVVDVVVVEVVVADRRRGRRGRRVSVVAVADDAGVVVVGGVDRWIGPASRLLEQAARMTATPMLTIRPRPTAILSAVDPSLQCPRPTLAGGAAAARWQDRARLYQTCPRRWRCRNRNDGSGRWRPAPRRSWRPSSPPSARSPPTAPRGDGHPVLVLPGLGAGDASTRPLRWFLDRLGYRTQRVGPGHQHRSEPARLDGPDRPARRDSSTEHGRRVSLVGWSLGGVFASGLAAHTPYRVRNVITLGSPLRGAPPVPPAIPAHVDLQPLRRHRPVAGLAPRRRPVAGERRGPRQPPRARAQPGRARRRRRSPGAARADLDAVPAAALGPAVAPGAAATRDRAGHPGPAPAPAHTMPG